MCIFNFCWIFKVYSCHLFQLYCRPPGIRTLRNLDCLAIRWLLPSVGEIRLLLSIANHSTAFVKLKQMRTLPQNNKILKLFKRIIAPRRGAAPRFASLPDGGRGRRSGSPFYMVMGHYRVTPIYLILCLLCMLYIHLLSYLLR